MGQWGVLRWAAPTALGPIEDGIAHDCDVEVGTVSTNVTAAGERERVQDWMEPYAGSHFQTTPSFCSWFRWSPLISSGRILTNMRSILNSLPC